mmetsp:Transcript_107591/g.169846  ORF Transcript_107591/g.169846 Transcript_107591/m.169846 type:complete len:219 (-) Transcript_107591:363-1019(-)|eukprot:CAMPEP_0169123924 /NCGR_PEP_ID=MMETSP1015-20121227/34046_1 /TAXON_ID=342587 /ORGANISM="Karlodinium micrum, Strain CCMP2283" /LENGTH=218 /DNA_ID=CAMNT_0009187297 /DNA_START=70 /DNA_END=726 /DNA_ORIENTATION=+
MAVFFNEQSVTDFQGLKFVEKNTFMHFVEETSDWLCKSRSKSAPATTRTKTSTDSASVAPWVSEIDKQARPSHVDQIDESMEWIDGEDVYTVMIRGLPCSCKKEDILEAVEEIGFDEKHDFFYVPTRKGKSLGYAFIGFPDPQLTRNFAKAMTGYRFGNKMSSKTVTVTPASIQGFGNNLNHFKSTSVMQSAAKPLFLQPRGLANEISAVACSASNNK